MISITVEGARVVCKITGAYPIGGWRYPFSFNAGAEDTALLLADNLRDALETKLQSIKQHHYEQGRSDQRKRKCKRTSFCTNWDVDR